jgi:hypothetical protein
MTAKLEAKLNPISTRIAHLGDLLTLFDLTPLLDKQSSVVGIDG